MVWKSNLFVGETPKALERRIKIEGFRSFEGFLRDIFGYFDDFSNTTYFSDPRDAFRIGGFLDDKHFPKHIMFANFKCLRCGFCCKNYDSIEVARELIIDWRREGRNDILKYVDDSICEIQSRSWTGCPFCRKATGKPYYNCKIHSYKERITACRPYLCSKSVPVAQINFGDVDELLTFIGLERYYELIEKDWGEVFDYSKSDVKTHKRIV
jgi:hypothetical protein